MKKSIFIVVFIAFVSFSYSQIALPEANSDINGTVVPPEKKVEYTLNTGTSFSTGALSGSSYYIAPEMTYRFSPKFKLHTGVIFLNSNMTVPSSSLNLDQSQPRLFDQKSSETIVYASGDYQLNTRLMITGSIIKNFNSPMNSKLQNAAWQNSFQMMSMGFHYKITPNMTIGADFKMIQGDNLYTNPLYYNLSNYNSPFPDFR